MAEDNPFLALFENGSVSKSAKPNANEASSISSMPSKPLLTSDSKETNVSGGSTYVQKLNEVIENIFCFTLNPYGLLGRPANDPVKQSGLVILESVALELQHEQNGRTWLGLDILSQALFERLLMTSDDLRKSLIVEEDKEDKKSHATESLVITYLVQAFFRAYNLQQQLLNRNFKIKEESDEEIIEAVKQIKALVVQNSCTAYSESELYHGQDLLNQTIGVFETYEIHHEAIIHWFEAVTSEMDKEGSYSKAKQITFDVLTVFKQDIFNSPFMVLCDRQVSKLQYFIKTPTCAKIFMEFNFPADGNLGKPTGIAFQNTLIGNLLSKSNLPLNEFSQYDFFQEPSKQPGSVHAATESRIWTGLEIIHEMVYEIFNLLFRSSDSSVQKQTLKWIQSCLQANSSRGKMWTGQQILLNNSLASDGFMLNLSAVLLRFCHPLCVKNKILKVDPSYAWTLSKQLSEETFLLSSEEAKNQEEEKEFNFITEIFFLTQKSLDLGLRVCHEKFVKMNQELGRHQQVYRESMAQNQGSSAAEAVQQRMDVIMTKYLSLKAALLVPSATDNGLSLCASTGSWLTQIALNKTTVELDQIPKELNFPLEESTAISPGLYRIPEFVMENICEQLLLVRRFCPHKFEDNPISNFLDFILTFMGSPKWVKNPHLRARLAESLENLLPAHSIENASPALAGSSWQRQQIFIAHPHRHAIVPTLLSVFVDIETTGQAVEFEQKFGYRRPMYDVMKYIWSIPDYQEKFVELAKHAEEHIEDEEAPLFLRFVNLLINDAIFLLDEALGYMKQIQEQQLEQSSNWSSLPAQERAQNQSQLLHMGRLARYHNIMGTETIQMLDKLTEKIHQVFTHRTMVDRMSSMLNYFLVNLVGPKRKSFKVKNLEEFSFKPGEIVTDISKIYLNLKDCDSFLASISRDGRSYTPDLFKQATEVLIKIGRSDLVSEVIALDAKVQEVAKNYRADEALFADAPDHFLDSILSHLMTDPVRLPHSGMVVDRSTIARHLLSDQMDPFTRAPLTMEQLEPMDQLKEEIVLWMQRKRNESQ